jgi:hypothetical protein
VCFLTKLKSGANPTTATRALREQTAKEIKHLKTYQEMIANFP